MSWGVRITALYLACVALIVTLVFVSANQDIELESKDYYAQELKYQKNDALNNSNDLNSTVSL
ncbi:MAG: FixH family protein [Bacteroidetes bacterium]|nr:FixH family protein [Bacteroidota bacterium]